MNVRPVTDFGTVLSMVVEFLEFLSARAHVLATEINLLNVKENQKNYCVFYNEWIGLAALISYTYM